MRLTRPEALEGAAEVIGSIEKYWGGRGNLLEKGSLSPQTPPLSLSQDFCVYRILVRGLASARVAFGTRRIAQRPRAEKPAPAGKTAMSTPFARGPLLILLGPCVSAPRGPSRPCPRKGRLPYVIGALRMLVGGLALLLWCAFRGAPRFWRWPMRCVVPSTLALLGFQFFFFSGACSKPGSPWAPWSPLASRPSSWPCSG